MQTGKCTSTCKTACELEFAHCYLINFTYATCKVTFFIKHFLTIPILVEGSTLINIGFFTKEDFWYVYITFIRVKKFSFIHKSCKVDAITSILRKTTYILYTILRNYLAENLNFAELSETALLSKNSKFHNIRTLRWIFHKFNPKRRWTLIPL